MKYRCQTVKNITVNCSKIGRIFKHWKLLNTLLTMNFITNLKTVHFLTELNNFLSAHGIENKGIFKILIEADGCSRMEYHIDWCCESLSICRTQPQCWFSHISIDAHYFAQYPRAFLSDSVKNLRNDKKKMSLSADINLKFQVVYPWNIPMKNKSAVYSLIIDNIWTWFNKIMTKK